MNIEIITQKLELTISGFSGVAVNKDYAGMAFKLSGKMWETVKGNDIKNKGKNIWVYEDRDRVFAGVELEQSGSAMEEKKITLEKYAYYKHIGPYSLVKQVGTAMRNELSSKGMTAGLPYIEIYGHWKKNEAECETELLISLV
jgi:predicted transcriptional regulator YdeE